MDIRRSRLVTSDDWTPASAAVIWFVQGIAGRCGGAGSFSGPCAQSRVRKDRGNGRPHQAQAGSSNLLRSVLGPASRGSTEDDAARAVCRGGLLLCPEPRKGGGLETAYPSPPCSRSRGIISIAVETV